MSVCDRDLMIVDIYGFLFRLHDMSRGAASGPGMAPRPGPPGTGNI